MIEIILREVYRIYKAREIKKEENMAKFLDHHPMPPMSPEQGKAMTGEIKSAIDSKNFRGGAKCSFK
jgi:hypothetical protein